METSKIKQPMQWEDTSILLNGVVLFIYYHVDGTTSTSTSQSSNPVQRIASWRDFPHSELCSQRLNGTLNGIWMGYIGKWSFPWSPAKSLLDEGETSISQWVYPPVIKRRNGQCPLWFADFPSEPNFHLVWGFSRPVAFDYQRVDSCGSWVAFPSSFIVCIYLGRFFSRVHFEIIANDA